MKKSVIVLSSSVAIVAVAILLYIASIGGFDPSRRVISDPVEGTETQVVENPAPPEHSAFPSSATTNAHNDLSLSAEANNNSFA